MLLIVTPDGLLLHHRDDKPGIAHPDCWAGFGGAVEDGETVGEALLREVREETSLIIDSPVFLVDVLDHEASGRLVSLFYVEGDYRLEDIDLQEGAGVAIHPAAALPDLKLAPFIRRAIEGHLLPLLADRLPSLTERRRIAPAAGLAGGSSVPWARKRSTCTTAP